MNKPAVPHKTDPVTTPDTTCVPPKKTQRPRVSSCNQAAVFFPVSLIKLSVMSVFTLGFYDFYWFYRNWQKLAKQDNKPISPMMRATFSVFYCFSLFQSIKNCARQNAIKPACPSPKMSTLAYVLLLICSILPFPFGMVSWLAFIPLMRIQKTVNALNTRLCPHILPNNRFDWKDILALAVGISIFALRYTVVLSVQQNLLAFAE